MWEAKRVFVTQILLPANVSALDYGWIYRIILDLIENCKQYKNYY
jgi:hypothetical protein